MGCSQSKGCSKEGRTLQGIIESNCLPQFRVGDYGELLGKIPSCSDLEFIVEDGVLYVSGKNSNGFSVIGGDLIYSFVGNVENDPTIKGCCCK